MRKVCSKVDDPNPRPEPFVVRRGHRGRELGQGLFENLFSRSISGLNGFINGSMKILSGSFHQPDISPTSTVSEAVRGS
jgi:hypothetical protein